MSLFLQNNLICVEEFHHNIQEMTNFPLRPFVLPFLRTHLPSLQRDLVLMARNNKQVGNAHYSDIVISTTFPVIINHIQINGQNITNISSGLNYYIYCTLKAFCENGYMILCNFIFSETSKYWAPLVTEILSTIWRCPLFRDFF